MITLEHRKTAINAELLQNAVNGLVDTLAKKAEEVETLQAKVKELEAKLSPKPDDA